MLGLAKNCFSSLLVAKTTGCPTSFQIVSGSKCDFRDKKMKRKIFRKFYKPDLCKNLNAENTRFFEFYDISKLNLGDNPI